MRAIKKIKESKYGVFAFLTSFLLNVLVLIYTERFIGSGGIFLHDDLLLSYPIFSLKDILGGYSFQLSFGNEIYPTIYSPFLMTLLFIKDRNVAFSLSIFLKFSFASLFAQKFFEKRITKNQKIYSVIFGVLYAGCAYNTIYYYNEHFLDGVYLLPVLVDCWLDFYNDRKKCIKLILVLVYSFVVNYYSAYMLGVFLAVFCALYSFIYGKENRVKNLVKNLLLLFLCALQAALIASIFLLPLANGLFSAGTLDSVHGKLADFPLYFQDFFSGFYFEALRSQKCVYPALYTGTLTLFMSLYFFVGARKNNYKKELCLFGGLTLFILLISFVPVFYLAIHMFNDPDGSRYRFTYIFSFLMCSMASFSMEKIERNKKRELIVFGVVLVLYIVCLILQSNYSKEVILSWKGLGYSFLIMFIYLLIRSMRKYRLKVISLYFFTVLELLVNNIVLTENQSYSMDERSIYYYSWERETNSAISQINEIDKSMFRVIPYNTSNMGLNEAKLFQFNSISCFNPALNKNVKNIMENLGYGTGSKAIFNKGGSRASDSVLAVKYYLAGSVYNLDDACHIEVNDTSLPFIFGAAGPVKNLTLNTGNAFENQNGLISCLVGEELSIFIPCKTEKDYEFSYVNCGILNDEEHEQYIIGRLEDDEDAEIRVSFIPVDSTDDIYVYLDQNMHDYIYMSPSIESDFLDTKNLYNDLYMGNIIKLTGCKGQEVDFKIVFDENTDDVAYLKNIYVYEFDQKEWDKAYQNLSQNGLYNEKWEKSTLTGEIDISDNHPVMFTSIPYSDNWTLYIDGEKVDIYPIIGDAFLAADILPGHHSIKLTYHNPLVTVGLIISCVGIFSFSLVYILIKRSNKGLQKQ